MSAPASSSDVMLSMTKVQLDLISNVEMYLFFQEDIRCNVCHIFKRYSKTNNKYLLCYDPKKPTKYIIYLEKSNLYSHSMSKSFQTERFKWLDPAKFNLHNYDNNNFRVFVFNVNLEYLTGLQKLHNHYLLVLDKLGI